MKHIPSIFLVAGLAGGVMLPPPVWGASDPNEAKDETCPRLAVLADGDHATVFSGQGHDVTDIVRKVKLSAGDYSCKHRKDGEVDVYVSAKIDVKQGLAADRDVVEVPFFVAIIDPEQLVVTRQSAVARVKIEAGQREGAAIVELGKIRLGLAEGTRGADLEVLLSLQLDQDQLAYNRAGH